MFKNMSSDSVLSGRTCPANLDVRTCPVKPYRVNLNKSKELVTITTYVRGRESVSMEISPFRPQFINFSKTMM